MNSFTWLENMKKNEGMEDYEYLPDGRNKWDDKKYQSKLKNMSDAWNSCVLKLSGVKNQNLNRIRKTESEIFSEHSVGGGK